LHSICRGIKKGDRPVTTSPKASTTPTSYYFEPSYTFDI
jgi:hypothetical protein